MTLSENDLKIINLLEHKIAIDSNYLDFNGFDTKYLTHGYHTYPAMMIPHLAKELIEITLDTCPKISNIYDPFMGSGTTLIEGIVHNLNSYGSDINPLSQLMSRAKTNPIEPRLLQDTIHSLRDNILKMNELHNEGIYHIQNLPTFDKIDFWFKPHVTNQLQLIKNCIKEIDNNDIQIFLLATFSETVRYVSNTRNNEFKLYRMATNKLEEWNPDVINVFFKNLDKNSIGNKELFLQLNKIHNFSPNVLINGASNTNLPNNFKNDMFDLVVTSPPYGDSKTTVAYGQFSRLSAQWLDLKIDEQTKINQLDNIMLGGKVDKEVDLNNIFNMLKSKTLFEIYSVIEKIDKKRALEVLQFYIDLDKSIKETTRVMKVDSYQFWVVANRTVKSINIPTDTIISELFEKYNVKHLKSFYRNIPNKRMPSKNSPTNIAGNHSVTMTSEIILMLKKIY